MPDKKDTIWNRTFICLLLSQIGLALSQNIVNPLVSSYAEFLGAGAMLVGLLTGLYFGVAVAMRPFSGPAVVFLDKKKLLVFSFALGIIVNLCYGTFISIPLFLLSRALHGVQFSIVGSLLITMVGDSIPQKKLGSGLGVFSASVAIATAIGPSIGIAVKSWGNSNFGEIGGYKAIFYAASIVMVISMIPCILTNPEKRTKSEIASTGAWYNNIIALPAIPPAVSLMFITMSFSLFGAYLVPYAAQKGFSGISVFFTVYAGVMLLSRPLVGKLTDKYGASAMIYPGVLVMIISYIILWRAQSITTVYISAVFAALGFGTANPAAQTICLQVVTPIKRGAASNTNYLGLDLGFFFGPILGSTVISHYLGTGEAYSNMFLFGAVPLVLSLIMHTMSKKYIKQKILDVLTVMETAEKMPDLSLDA